ncbi:MFS transporter [Nocardiopsis sp. N85]|uniref:MFS transporter n=1 Tax=Nocardiopsis sp. N85 TaxID=3029400 RepID=UPI00237F49FD|nr:MFS transporter [Nocardiopsis sp. N85]MDE3725208.1 MFS transporter [Nocardiopsis sp. N85]
MSPEPSSPPVAARTAPGGARGWSAVGALTLGIFALMTTELLPVGLLTPMARDLGIEEARAGLTVTVPGIVAAVSAPLTATVIGRLDRRLVLAGLLVLLIAGNVVTAVGPSLTAVLAARVAIGAAIGGFWAVAGGLAPRLVPARHVGRATAVIFSGVSAASVVGVPLGTLLAEAHGWRLPFGAAGLLGLIALAGVLAAVPSLPVERSLRPADLGGLLLGRDGGVRLGVILTLLLVAGHFTAYTFVRPLLHEETGMTATAVGGALLLFGVAGLVGNFIAGTLGADHVRGVLWTIAATLALTMLLFSTVGHTPWAALLVVGLWGLAYGGVSVGLQTWMLTVAPQSAEPATSLFVAAFNAAIALGALLGGLALTMTNPTGVLALAGILLAAALLLLTARGPALPRTSPPRGRPRHRE